MKSFADRSFFLLFDEILRRDRPKSGPDRWSAAGVTWQRARHTFETDSHGFAIETYEIVSSGRPGWTLLVAREHWWTGRQGETMRSARWAKPLRGSRTAILSWFRDQQRALDAGRGEGS